MNDEIKNGMSSNDIISDNHLMSDRQNLDTKSFVGKKSNICSVSPVRISVEQRSMDAEDALRSRINPIDRVSLSASHTPSENKPQLNFGVEKILSLPPKMSRQASTLHLPSGDWRYTERCMEGCLQCTWLYRSQPHPAYLPSCPPHVIHAPKPLRPFPNRLIEGREESRGKRKRSWSRAVFSSLQRKGLEKRFQLQKYITKPDRRQLAATLGLTDAQVKVWFQNRRMKWRHAKEVQDSINSQQSGQNNSDL